MMPVIWTTISFAAGLIAADSLSWNNLDLDPGWFTCQLGFRYHSLVYQEEDLGSHIPVLGIDLGCDPGLFSRWYSLSNLSA